MMRKFSKILALVLAFAMVLCPVLTAAAEAESDVLWSSAVLDVEDASAGATKAILTVDTIEEVNAINFAINFAKGVTFDPETAVVKLVADGDSGEEVEVWNVVSSYEDGVLNVVAIDGDDMAAVTTHLVFNIDITVDNAADYEFYLTKIYAVGAGASDSDEVIASFQYADNDQSGVIDVEAARAAGLDYIAGTTCAHANTSTETVVDATCTEAGSTVVTCKDCGYTVSTPIKALGHSFGGTDATYRVVVEPFGGAAGYAVYNALCDRDCGTWNVAYFNEDGTVKEGVDFAALVADEDPNVEEVFCEPTTELTKDETGHWYVCACGGKHEFAEHTAGDAVEVERVDAQPGVAGYYVTVVTCTECEYEISRTTNTIPALPVEPEVVDSITITPSINLTETINLRYILAGIPECDDFYIEFTHDRCDGSYDFIEGGYTYTVYKKNLTPAGARFAYLYNQIRLYELGLEVTAKVYCLDANDNVIYVSNENKTTVAAQAKASFASSSNAKAKTLYSDIIELGAVAQTYFVNGKDVDLADVALPNAGFTGTPTGDIDPSTLNSVNTYNPVDSAVSISGSLTISGNPVIRFQVSGAGKFDASNLKLVVSYKSPKYGDISQTYTTADMTPSGSGASIRYFALFNSVALCDGNQGVTAALYDGDTLVGSLDYSIEAAIAASKSTSRAYSLYMHTAKLGVSARAYWNL